MPLGQDDPGTMLGGDKDDFQYFTFNPFQVKEERDEDATVTKWQFKALSDKLDTLLVSSKSSSCSEKSFKLVKALIETFTKEHANTLQASTKSIENSDKTVRETTEKVKKLLADTTKFMEEFHSSPENNIATGNKVITNLSSILQFEKEAILKVHSGL